MALIQLCLIIVLTSLVSSGKKILYSIVLSISEKKVFAFAQFHCQMYRCNHGKHYCILTCLQSREFHLFIKRCFDCITQYKIYAHNFEYLKLYGCCPSVVWRLSDSDTNWICFRIWVDITLSLKLKKTSSYYWGGKSSSSQIYFRSAQRKAIGAAE